MEGTLIILCISELPLGPSSPRKAVNQVSLTVESILDETVRLSSLSDSSDHSLIAILLNVTKTSFETTRDDSLPDRTPVNTSECFLHSQSQSCHGINKCHLVSGIGKQDRLD